MAWNISKRMQHIRAVLRARPYLFLLIPASLLYLLASIATYLYIYNGNLWHFYAIVPPLYSACITVLTILISLLLGIAIVLAIAKIKEVRAKSLGLGVSGIIVGSLAAGCPGCVFGLFPLVLGLFGISGTLAILPWNGIELQLVTVVLLCVSILSMASETEITCPPRKRRR